MICSRWTPRATATLANLGGSSRPASSVFSRGGSDARPRRGFSSRDQDGLTDLLSVYQAQTTSSGPTNPSAYPLRRQPRPRDATVNAASVDRRPRPKSNTNGYRQPRRNQTIDDDAEIEPSTTPGQVWPQLQRRERGGRRPADGSTGNEASLKRLFPPRENIQNPQGTTDSARIMLVVDGLSPNLSATDFYRIAPNDLSSWGNAITKIQQQRNPDTLEPLGRYLVTFSTGQAAASYRDRLVRLHKLNGFKLRSTSGLWESSVPAALKVSLVSPAAAAAGSTEVTENNGPATTAEVPSTESVVDVANTFTLAPGSQAVLQVDRRRVAVVRPWTNRLAGLVENLGYGERPSVLMVDVYPPTLTAKDLYQFIHRDGQNRQLRWQVSMPQHLQMHSGAEQGPARVNARRREVDEHDKDDEDALDKQPGPSLKLNDRETLEKLKGRFVLACADEAEARRFQQSWNRRTLTTLRPRPARYMVSASMIHW